MQDKKNIQTKQRGICNNVCRVNYFMHVLVCHFTSLILLHSLHGKYSTGVKPLMVIVENGNFFFLMKALISLSK